MSLANQAGLPPVVSAGVEIMILGSFPGIASLAQAQYYGHPRNQFWRLTGAALGEPLWDMEYGRRLRTLLRHRIGLWDIIGGCTRAGSLDSNIRRAQRNDFTRVTRIAHRLRRVCFNGATAGKMAPTFAQWGFETMVLPSSSAANTMPLREKQELWMKITDPVPAC